VAKRKLRRNRLPCPKRGISLSLLFHEASNTGCPAYPPVTLISQEERLWQRCALAELNVVERRRKWDKGTLSLKYMNSYQILGTRPHCTFLE